MYGEGGSEVVCAHECRCLSCPEEGAGSGGVDGCEHLDVGARSHTKKGLLIAEPSLQPQTVMF